MSLLLAFTGCEKDTVEEPGLPTVSKPVIAVKENTPTSFCVEWDAVEGAEEYLYSVSKNDAEGSMTEVRPETRTAATLFTIDDASAATRYTVRVKTIASADSQLGDSDFAEIFLETPAEGNSVQAFTFGSLSVTYSSVTVTVTPSQAEESYYAAPVKTSLLIGKNSNDIVKMVKGDITEASLKKGVQEFVFGQLDPSTNYTVVAFGYDWEKGVSTSQLSRSEEIGTTPDQRASLDLSVLSTGDTSISAKCIPSDGEVSYYMTVLPATAFAGMTVSGNRIGVTVSTELLRDDIVQRQKELGARLRELAGLNGVVEFVIEVREDHSAVRPIKPEDKLAHLRSKNAQLDILRRDLDLEME